MGPVKARGEGRLLQDRAMSALRRAWTPDPDAGAVVRGTDEFDTGGFEDTGKLRKCGWPALRNAVRSFDHLDCAH